MNKSNRTVTYLVKSDILGTKLVRALLIFDVQLYFWSFSRKQRNKGYYCYENDWTEMRLWYQIRTNSHGRSTVILQFLWVFSYVIIWIWYRLSVCVGWYADFFYWNNSSDKRFCFYDFLNREMLYCLIHEVCAIYSFFLVKKCVLFMTLPRFFVDIALDVLIYLGSIDIYILLFKNAQRKQFRGLGNQLTSKLRDSMWYGNLSANIIGESTVWTEIALFWYSLTDIFSI